MKSLFTNQVVDDIIKPQGIIQEMIEDKIREMKDAVEKQCKDILIFKGIAHADMTPYEWRRLSKLLETREDGITYYYSQKHEVKCYQVKYYEPPMPDWTKPDMPFVVQMGSYQVTAL